MPVLDPQERYVNYISMLTPPEAGITDAPLLCLSVNAEWWSFIAGSLSSLLQSNIWGEDAIQSILEFIASVKVCQSMVASFSGVADGESVTIDDTSRIITLDVLLDGELYLDGELLLL